MSLLHLLVFLLGIHMGMQSIAAAYLIIDLGYDRRGNARLIVGGIAGWWLATGAVYVLLSEQLSQTYTYGLLSCVPLYVFAFYSIRLLFPRLAPRDTH